MLDLFTYFIYISLLLTIVFLTGYKQKFATSELSFKELPKLRLQHFIALLLISFIVGFRYKVGVDWQVYKSSFEIFQYNPNLKHNEQTMELGFFAINKIIANWGLSYEWMFFAVALLTWYFFFKSVPKIILPLFIFFLFVDEYFFWGLNGVRQFIALSIWLAATRFIINKKIMKYILLIGIASLFHKSVLILLPLYFLQEKKHYNKILIVSMFIGSLIVGSSKGLISLTETITLWLGQHIQFINTYATYIGTDLFEVNSELETGWGYIFKILVNLIIILIGNNIVKKNPNTSIYFVLFFIGAILFNLSYNIQIISRINNYFLIVRSVVLAIIVWHYWKNFKNRYLIIGFCSLYFIIFLRAIFNSSNMCSPFQFSF